MSGYVRPRHLYYPIPLLDFRLFKLFLGFYIFERVSYSTYSHQPE